MSIPVSSPAFSARPSSLWLDLRAFDLAGSSLTLRSGQGIAFTRPSGSARYVDANGIYGTAASGELRVEMIDADTPVILLERDTINRLGRSSDFSTLWQLNNTPTITVAALVLGDLKLSLIADTSAASVANVQHQPTMVGDGVKSFALVVAQGTGAASGSEIFYSDFTSGPTDKFRATLTWAAGVPTLTATVGTVLGKIARGGGAYEFWCQTLSVTASHTNVFQISPAKTSAELGSIYAGGVQLVDAPWPTSLIETPTNAVVERQPDTITIPISFAPGTVGWTIYGKLWLATAQSRTDPLVMIGSTNITSDAQRGVGILRGATGTMIIRETTGSTHTDATSAAVAGSTPGMHEFLAHVLPASIDIAIDGAGATSSAQALIASFSSSLVTLPGDNNARWHTLKIAAAPALTLADMQVLE